MPIKRNTKRSIPPDLLESLDKLNEFIINFRVQQGLANKKIEAEQLKQAAEIAHNLLTLVQLVARYVDPKVLALDHYMQDMIKIVEVLRDIANSETKRYPSPNKYMEILTSSFEKFVSKIASKKTRERIRRVASFIPVVDGVVASCGGIPYYFEHAGRYEKAAMILSAVLLLTALAMTITLYASPALLGIPFMATLIAGCVLFSRVLYDQAAINAKKNFAAKPIVSNAAISLADTVKNFNRHVDVDLRTMATTERKMFRFIDDSTKIARAENDPDAGVASNKRPSYLDYGSGTSRGKSSKRGR